MRQPICVSSRDPESPLLDPCPGFSSGTMSHALVSGLGAGLGAGLTWDLAKLSCRRSCTDLGGSAPSQPTKKRHKAERNKIQENPNYAGLAHYSPPTGPSPALQKDYNMSFGEGRGTLHGVAGEVERLDLKVITRSGKRGKFMSSWMSWKNQVSRAMNLPHWWRVQ